MILPWWGLILWTAGLFLAAFYVGSAMATNTWTPWRKWWPRG